MKKSEEARSQGASQDDVGARPAPLPGCAPEGSQRRGQPWGLLGKEGAGARAPGQGLVGREGRGAGGGGRRRARRASAGLAGRSPWRPRASVSPRGGAGRVEGRASLEVACRGRPRAARPESKSQPELRRRPREPASEEQVRGVPGPGSPESQEGCLAAWVCRRLLGRHGGRRGSPPSGAPPPRLFPPLRERVREPVRAQTAAAGTAGAGAAPARPPTSAQTGGSARTLRAAPNQTGRCTGEAGRGRGEGARQERRGCVRGPSAGGALGGRRRAGLRWAGQCGRPLRRGSYRWRGRRPGRLGEQTASRAPAAPRGRGVGRRPSAASSGGQWWREPDSGDTGEAGLAPTVLAGRRAVPSRGRNGGNGGGPRGTWRRMPRGSRRARARGAEMPEHGRGQRALDLFPRLYSGRKVEARAHGEERRRSRVRESLHPIP